MKRTTKHEKITGKQKPASIRDQDPFLEREKSRYEQPLPSREYILQTLEDQGVPVSEPQLYRLLGVEPHEERLMMRRIAAMEREGQVIRNRKDAICVVDKLDLISGRVPVSYTHLTLPTTPYV